MKLCIFAGTFNPIHNAHIKIAQYVLLNFGFDKIIFIPSFQPPHKDFDKNLSIHRYKMVELAIKNNPHFEISDIEFKRDKKSYTYDTVCELYKKYKTDGKINFIIGTDAFEKIESWYRTNDLKKLIDFIVFVRENDTVNFDILKEKGYNFKFANMEFLNISSTEIREKIRKNESISDIVPKDAEEYIIKNGLYKN